MKPIGIESTLVLNRDGWQVIPEKDRMVAVPMQRAKDHGLDKHMHNFVEAITTNNQTILAAPIHAGAHIAVFSQMGNIAYRTGEKLYWDSTKRKFTNKKANNYLSAKYNNGYKLPQV